MTFREGVPAILVVLFFSLLLGVHFGMGSRSFFNDLGNIENPDATRDSAYGDFGIVPTLVAATDRYSIIGTDGSGMTRYGYERVESRLIDPIGVPLTQSDLVTAPVTLTGHTVGTVL
ncbi:unnamed protein product [Cyclocybe aegerita]|uniref:Uncharacterized protein n=1 Tax=Cyclocybe aegerita TaxID=1973307 RepID=A0A8S0XHH2_CYCAE|nr:unnamed protein product [Cyclocybe aegerita]